MIFKIKINSQEKDYEYKIYEIYIDEYHEYQSIEKSLIYLKKRRTSKY